MDIRVASQADAKSIAQIHTLSWRNTYQKALTKKYLSDVVPLERIDVWENRFAEPKPNQYVVVAEDEGKIVGFACAYAGENDKWGSYLDNLHLLKEYQSRGIGKSLLREVATWCYKRLPDRGMCLLVNQDNTNAQGFYKALGACNAQEGVWNAPDGSVVPTF